MKNTFIASACVLALATTPVLAGNLSDPVVAPQVVIDDAIESSSDDMQGMLALLTIALILSASMGAY